MQIKIPFSLKYKNIFNQDFWPSLKNIPKLINRWDKIFIIFGLIITLTGIFCLGFNQWLKNTHEVPAFGSTLNEGIVGTTSDLEKHTLRLTNAGLTYLAENGDIKGDLAESREILDDGKTYKFKIRSGFNAQDLAEQIKIKNVWPNIEIEASDEQFLIFRFKQPFSPFLYISTEPIFPYGPYKLAKEEKTRMTYVASDSYWQGKPHIEKIVMNLFADEESLLSAVKHGEVDSFYANSAVDEADDYRQFEMILPRELILFFNLSKPVLQDVTVRKNLKEGKALDKEITLELATSDTEKNMKIAEGLKTKWASLKVTINIHKYDKVTIQKEIIPNRNYDILLYGLDYGPDPDPYPFWHSSQIKPDGMNLSNYSNKTSDKLLEEARQSYDFKVREEKYASFRDILNQQMPFIALNKETYYYYVSDKIKGVEKIFGSSEHDRFLQINKWYINSKRVKN